MIEAIMFFLMGFFVAAGVAAAFGPVVWRQAARVTSRRAQAALPTRWVEFQANHDQLRAEYAVAMRRLELDTMESRRRLASQSIELGEKTSALANVSVDIEHRDMRIEALEEAEASAAGTIARQKETNRRLELALHEAESLAAERATELKAQTALLDDVSATADSRRVEIAALATKIETLKDRIAELKEADATARERIAGLAESEREKSRLLHMLEVASEDEIRAELVSLRTERDAQRAVLEDERRGRQALSAEIEALRRNGAGIGRVERDENARLKEQIEALASDVLRGLPRANGKLRANARGANGRAANGARKDIADGVAPLVLDEAPAAIGTPRLVHGA